MRSRIHNLKEVFLLHCFILSATSLIYGFLIFAFYLFTGTKAGPEAIVWLIPIAYFIVPGLGLLSIIFFFWALFSKKQLLFFSRFRIVLISGLIIPLIIASWLISPFTNNFFTNLAVEHQQIAWCKLVNPIPGIGLRESLSACLSKVSVATNNPGTCPPEGPADNIDHYHHWCLTEITNVNAIKIAKATGDATICENLAKEIVPLSSGGYIECFTQAAITKNDIKICNLITPGFTNNLFIDACTKRVLNK